MQEPVIKKQNSSWMYPPHLWYFLILFSKFTDAADRHLKNELLKAPVIVKQRKIKKSLIPTEQNTYRKTINIENITGNFSFFSEINCILYYLLTNTDKILENIKL